MEASHVAGVCLMAAALYGMGAGGADSPLVDEHFGYRRYHGDVGRAWVYPDLAVHA